MSRALYIAAKAPRPGLVKTRLAAQIGEAAAARLYTAFLTDFASVLALARIPTGWYITPADSWPELEPISPGPTAKVRIQPGGTWGARQDHLFQECAADGEAPVVLVASDSPHLRAADIESAFAALELNDLVLGPTDDGGYYLVGMRAYHPVLAGIQMSTSTALQQVTGRAERMGMRVALLRSTFDVDVAADLVHLGATVAERDDMPATRAVLASL